MFADVAGINGVGEFNNVAFCHAVVIYKFRHGKATADLFTAAQLEIGGAKRTIKLIIFDVPNTDQESAFNVQLPLATPDQGVEYLEQFFWAQFLKSFSHKLSFCANSNIPTWCHICQLLAPILAK